MRRTLIAMLAAGWLCGGSIAGAQQAPSAGTPRLSLSPATAILRTKFG
ncbi:MAG: hypothetical protein JO347_03480, partial [Candidatus Eremiobacteraeota bacterium]|nr:hypothetical protein [Candidatus Eremiobacteraeota bacterium]